MDFLEAMQIYDVGIHILQLKSPQTPQIKRELTKLIQISNPKLSFISKANHENNKGMRSTYLIEQIPPKKQIKNLSPSFLNFARKFRGVTVLV
jgi:hypothetical protein